MRHFNFALKTKGVFLHCDGLNNIYSENFVTSLYISQFQLAGMFEGQVKHHPQCNAQNLRVRQDPHQAKEKKMQD
jgi:hypothetical protein